MTSVGTPSHPFARPCSHRLPLPPRPHSFTNFSYGVVLGFFLTFMNWRAEAMPGKPPSLPFLSSLSSFSFSPVHACYVLLRRGLGVGLGAEILTVVAIVIAVMMLAFVLITWALIWRHPKSTREAVGLGDSFCDQWDVSVRLPLLLPPPRPVYRPRSRLRLSLFPLPSVHRLQNQYQGGVYCVWKDEWDWDISTIRNLTFFTDIQATGTFLNPPPRSIPSFTTFID